MEKQTKLELEQMFSGHKKSKLKKRYLIKKKNHETYIYKMMDGEISQKNHQCISRGDN